MSIVGKLQLNLAAFKLRAEFEIPGSGITGVFGRSGSGKSSLLRVIAGLEPKVTGKLMVNGHTWQDQGKSLSPHKRPLAYVMQDATLFSHLNVQDNLEYGYRRLNAPHRHIKMDDAVALMSLEKLLGRSTVRLSGGEAKRVAIARAILTSPRLLLMDEPLSGLDAQSKDHLIPYIAKIQTSLDIPILYVSHAMDELALLANHLLLMSDGEVVACDQIDKMLTRGDLELAHRDDAESLFKAQVTGYDKDFNLTIIDLDGQRFYVTRAHALKKGLTVRLRILARDVSLTLSRPTQTSILNSLPAKIISIADQANGQALVRMQLASQILLARITRKSADVLALTPGLAVFAQVKSVALLV